MGDSRESWRALLLLALLSCMVGTASGLVVALFRIALEWGDRWRDAWITYAHAWPLAGLLVTIGGVAALAAAAAWLVQHFSPEAAGSGIPRVEAVARDELSPASFRVLPVKFIGGWLAIGGGLALGREGPSVQMGAILASRLAKMFRLTEIDLTALVAAGGGAGLAVAFNAPIAGAVFVLEELVRRLDTQICVAALGASCCAIAIARMLLGDGPDFKVAALPMSGLGSGILFVALGALAGLGGVLYNTAILGILKLGARSRWPQEFRAALIGGVVGMLAWFAPGLVGGGEAIAQGTLSGAAPIRLLPLFFGIRFVLGPLSYAAGTPGGLFAPMLVLGAQLGVLFSALCHLTAPHLSVSPSAFAIVGMAAFFTAVVRSPITGIVLVTELTAGFTLLIPMLWASFAAMLIPTLLGNMPIYDSLSQPRFLRRRGEQSSEPADAGSNAPIQN